MDTINGLPAHPLLVHIVVIAVPVAALTVIVSVLWPRARAWLGPTPAILTLLALIAVPIATSAGEALEKSLGAEPSETLANHIHYGDMVILWVGPLFGLAALWWLLTSPRVADARDRYLGAGVLRWTTVIVGIVTVIVALGSIAIVVSVGELGAESVWGRR
ncbi:hypothetical protein GOEFS_064_00240 [Gordonia effusa NBRC 100432]|uniref:Integral membrane protein n=1 Tax=Gordonia effusa NBRC 100432 TaxID=1077974 RepID=H0R134_9ACTN|nr:DUF2231 domain-containing protein [Gordonia effusa]GAB18785.1 hypothetical protein GOEFS_064_00240 [Gordonia effusa NBRC 100432]